ncbi:MAG TPA: hypothetical protein VF508_07555, partial [Pyrinomonadaceae bacterium]
MNAGGSISPHGLVILSYSKPSIVIAWKEKHAYPHSKLLLSFPKLFFFMAVLRGLLKFRDVAESCEVQEAFLNLP